MHVSMCNLGGKGLLPVDLGVAAWLTTNPGELASSFHDRALKESEGESRSVTSDSLRPHGLSSPWNSPGQNTGVGSLSLF